MSKLLTLIAAAAVSVALAAPAPAREGGHDHEFHDRDAGYHHRDGFRGGVTFYDPWFAYPYPSQDVYYFCPSANAYYPSIPSCPVPWQLVPAR